LSMTPIPPEQCGHVAPIAIDRAEDGYAARCLGCGTVGPVRATSTQARRALLGLGQQYRRWFPPTVSRRTRLDFDPGAWVYSGA
jgi:hypothetical protein